MIFGTTGHRVVQQNEPGDLDRFARLFLGVLRGKIGADLEMITGLARGWDTSVALACCELNIPFRAYTPFKGQERLWPEADRSTYLNLLCEAKSVTVEGGFPATVFYHLRDQRIVRDGEAGLLALDSGRPSGTHTTVLYADRIGRNVTPLWDDWIRFQNERKDRHE